MLGNIRKQIEAYLSLLLERPPKVVSKRKLKKLKKKEVKRQKKDLKRQKKALKKQNKLAKKSGITLKTGGKIPKDLKLSEEEDTGTEVAEKPAPSVPEVSECKNCGAALTGNFCHMCGQKDSDFQRPYWTFVEDFSDNIFSKDSKLWRTLGYLLFMPGAMTREYIAGRRIRFLPPIRTFLISIVLFFLTVSVFDVAIFKLTGEPITYQERLTSYQEDMAQHQEDIDAFTLVGDMDEVGDVTRDRDRVAARIERLEEWRDEQLAKPDQSTVRRTKDGQLVYDYSVQGVMFSTISEDDEVLPDDIIEDTFQFDADDDDPEFLNELGPKVQRGIKNATRDPRRLNNALNNWVPLIMGIFVPLTAVFLRFYYWKREHFLYNHLVFSLHFHTYLFFVLTFFVLAQVYLGSSVSTWMFAGAMPFYFFIALKVATGQGWFRTFFKFLTISLFYVIGFSVMLGTVFLFAFAEA